MFTRLDENILVAPQVAPADLAEARSRGVTMVINNRPDGEAPDQPTSAEMEAAARAAGLDYVAIPVTAGGFSLPQVEAMGEALATSGGDVLAFCRSGTRSTLLWALAQARGGADPDAIAAKARAAGYDVSPVRAIMETLARG